MITDINSKKMGDQMDEFKRQLEDVSSKVSMMFYALMGNDLTKDGGLIRRIDEIEHRLVETDKKILKIAQQQEKSRIYVNLIWAAAGATVIFIADKIFN